MSEPVDREALTPIMTAAQSRRVTREQMLRIALKEGTAVQRNGRWFVSSHAPGVPRKALVAAS